MSDFDDDLPIDDDGNLPDDDNNDDNAQVDDDLGFSFDEPSQDEDTAQLKAELAELRKQKQVWERANQPSTPTLRERPTIWQHDYDDDAFNADFDKWLEEKADYEKEIESRNAQYREVDEQYFNSVTAMRKLANDYDDVENVVIDGLDINKQALLKIAGGNDVARIVYALGKSPNKLAELAKLNVVDFIKQVALLEHSMQTRKSNKPAPKSHELTGVAGGGDSQLAKLLAEAERTGDRSKVIAYKKALKTKG